MGDSNTWLDKFQFGDPVVVAGRQNKFRGEFKKRTAGGKIVIAIGQATYKFDSTGYYRIDNWTSWQLSEATPDDVETWKIIRR